MTFNFKNALLAGTAIVAVGSIGAKAQAADLTLTGNSEWGVTAPVATPTAGDNVNLDSFNLTIDDTGDATAVGAITDTGTPRDGNVTVTSDTASADVTSTIGSVNIGGNFTVQTLDADNATVLTTVSGATTVGGNLAVTSTEADAADTVTLTLTGNAAVTGTTAVDAGGFAGANANLNVDGASNTFTGAVTVTGGTDAAADAFIYVSGASTTFTGGLALVDDTGDAQLTVDGTVAQTIGGTISGDGDILVTNTNASGVTFTGNITQTGALSVNNNGNNQAVIFGGNVASAIALGNNSGTDTITATFGGSSATTVSGGITGGASETIAVNILGGSTVNQSAGAWTGIDTLAISGNTILDSNAAITVGTGTTIASGSTLDVGTGLLTSAVSNAGTLKLTGTGGVTGAVTGAGLLDVDETATITGAVTQGTATIAGTKTLTVTSSYNVGTTTLQGAGATLAMTAGQNLTGNVVASTTGAGAITLADANAVSVVTGNIGTSTASLASLTVGGNGGNRVETTGNLYVNAIALDDADELRFIGDGVTQTVSGSIDDGNIVVGNGTTDTHVIFNGVVGTSNVVGTTVAANATARYNENYNLITGAFVNNGTAELAAGKVISSAAGFTGTGTWNIDVANVAGGTLATSNVGRLTSTGQIDLTGDTINFNYLGSSATGTIVWADGGAGTAVSGATVTDNSVRYNTSLAVNGQDLELTIAANSLNGLGTTDNNKAIGTVVDTLTTTTNTELAALQDNLTTASTQEEVNEVLESAGPTVDGGAVVGGFNASVQAIDVTNTRLASLREGGETGMVAGEMANGLTTWIQGFGQTADQDRRDGVDGYESDTYGMAVGIDTANLLEQGTVGASLSYANTDVDSKNANRTNSDVDSYQVSVFGDYDVAPSTYLTGMLAYAWNDIDQTRNDVGGVAGLDANAEFDSSQYIAYAEVGHDIALDDVTTLTPSVLAHYQHISIDDYTETGAGGLNLDVDNEDLDILEFGVGAEIAWDLDAPNGSKLRPALDVGYRHDVIGDNVQSTSNFTGGGASFETDGLEPAKGTFNVGASLGYAMDNNWEFTASYDYEVKSDFDAHSGYVRAGYKF
jgi:autotransporter family porin